jgi:hypothetical protein
MKPLIFIGSSEDDLAEFPKEAKGLAGNELWQVQLGLMPSDWKPMLNVGAGAYEIRVHVLGEWRVIYVAMHSDINRSERLHGKAPGAEEPECTQQYMRIPSTAQRSQATAQ